MTELIGFPLSVALSRLESEPTVIETAPPFAPKNRTPVWGDPRVLRVLEREGAIELLVARELLSEDTPSASPTQPL